jgi:hypothetical protein
LSLNPVPSYFSLSKFSSYFLLLISFKELFPSLPYYHLQLWGCKDNLFFFLCNFFPNFFSKNFLPSLDLTILPSKAAAKIYIFSNHPNYFLIIFIYYLFIDLLIFIYIFIKFKPKNIIV